MVKTDTSVTVKRQVTIKGEIGSLYRYFWHDAGMG